MGSTLIIVVATVEANWECVRRTYGILVNVIPSSTKLSIDDRP